jgi:regulatory ArsR family protein
MNISKASARPSIIRSCNIELMRKATKSPRSEICLNRHMPIEAFDPSCPPSTPSPTQPAETSSPSSGSARSQPAPWCKPWPIPQPSVSKHLRTLREAGLVRVRIEGPRRLYSLDPAPLAELDAWLAPYRAFWADKLDGLGNHLKWSD